ncbi:superinfection immunity protein, partial [Klebsiella pneumoniae]
TGSVFVINLFLGWTFIGWIWALVWAITSEQKREQIIVNNNVNS